jgi:hypothetical protein
LAILTINESKSRKNKSTSLIISAIFFDQHQSIVIQMNLNHSDTLDENLMKVIELWIKFSNECHEWYLNLYISAYFINNKRYFKNYRPINNYTVSTVINNLFLIEGIGIIQIEIFISEEMKIRFQINDIYYSL